MGFCARRPQALVMASHAIERGATCLAATLDTCAQCIADAISLAMSRRTESRQTNARHAAGRAPGSRRWEKKIRSPRRQPCTARYNGDNSSARPGPHDILTAIRGCRSELRRIALRPLSVELLHRV